MDNDKLNNNNKADSKASGDRPTVSFHDSLSSTSVPVENIGKYKLLRVLGEGGFSVVYLAEQSRPVKRLVALKVIKPGMDTKQVIARFELERQTLALLNHPNIAAVYDAGATEYGLPYFVMEHVKGIPITEHCDRHKLSIEDRLELFLQVCDGVQYAHQKGIIHRDIKPSNILISVDADKASPQIIDFGVSKAITKQINERTLFTEQGQFVGTPEYMSPEQAEMGAQDIDTRTDIYSLGVVLYELLAGALPFDPDTLRESSIDNIRRIIREQDPKKPSTRLINMGDEAKKIADNRSIDLTNLKKRLNRELEWIPLKAMRKDRTRRYRSVSQFADDIRNYLHGRPLLAGPESAVYKLNKFAHRNRTLITGITAVLIVLIAGIIVSTNFGIKASRAQKEAEAARIKAEQEARTAQEVSDFLRKDMLEFTDPFVMGEQDITVRSLLNGISEKLEGRFVNEPLIEAQIRYSIGKSYFNLGEYGQADAHLVVAYRLQAEKLGEKNIETLNTMELLGSLYMKTGRYTTAKTLFEKTYNVLGPDDPNTLAVMNGLAFVYTVMKNYDLAEKYLESAMNTEHENLEDNNPITLTSLHYFGLLEYNIGISNYDEQKLEQANQHYAKAEEYLIQALQGRQEVLGFDYPDTLETQYALGMLYWAMGRYSDAEYILDETWKQRRDKLGEQHPDTLATKDELIQLQYYMANPEPPAEDTLSLIEQ